MAGLRQGWAGGGGTAAAGAARVGAAGTAETEAGTSHVPHQTAVRYRIYDFLVDQYIIVHFIYFIIIFGNYSVLAQLGFSLA